MEHIKAYHGTIQERLKKILHERRFYTSDKNIEWLGKGTYFFYYLSHAWRWAEEQFMRKENIEKNKPGVLAVDIEIEPDNILDLDDPVQRKELDTFFEQVLKYSGNIRKELASHDKKKLLEFKRCMACNLFCEANPDKQMISYSFYGRNKRKDYTHYLFEDVERQLCVKDHSIIRNIKEVDRYGKEIN